MFLQSHINTIQCGYPITAFARPVEIKQPVVNNGAWEPLPSDINNDSIKIIYKTLTDVNTAALCVSLSVGGLCMYKCVWIHILHHACVIVI